jgi:hypothetical protein
MNLFKQVAASLSSPNKIALFRFQSIGKTIAYVFFLTLIAVLPTAFFLSSGVLNSADILRDMLAEEVPDFMIADGVLQTDAVEPIIARDGQTLFVFDPLGSGIHDQSGDYQHTVRVLRDKFILTVHDEVYSYSYDLLQGVPLSKETIISYLNSWENGLIIIVCLMISGLYILAAGSKFIGITFFACLGLIAAKMLNRNMTYKSIWTLAAYSGTWTTIFFTVTTFISFQLPADMIWQWLLTGTILLLAIKHVPARKKPSQP